MSFRGRLQVGLALAGASMMTFLSAPPARADAGPAATMVATYAPNVPAAARVAVDTAMAIWAQRLESAVPIAVDVDWGAGLPSGVAAATEPRGYFQVAPDGPFVVSALANAITGFDHDPSSADIHLILGAGIQWHTDVDTPAPASATDMVTMVLHELAHGLGFVGSFRPADAHSLRWGRAAGSVVVPVGLDAGLVDVATGARLVDGAAFANPSADLLAEATSGRVVWGMGARDARGHAPVMYTPASYEPHSSLMHLDDHAYPPGDPDALMTSLIRRGETLHRIGPATIGILADMGWRTRPEPPGSAASVARRAVAVAAAATTATTLAAPTTVAPVPTSVAAPIVAAPAAVVPVVRTEATDSGRVVDQGAFVVFAVAFAAAVALTTRVGRPREV